MHNGVREMKGEASLMEYSTRNGPIIEEKKRSGGIVHVNVQAQRKEKREREKKRNSTKSS